MLELDPRQHFKDGVEGPLGLKIEFVPRSKHIPSRL